MPDPVWAVVERSWSQPFHISSNYARSNSTAVAVASSLGWITNITPDGMEFSRKWHSTMEGLNAVRNRHLMTPKE